MSDAEPARKVNVKKGEALWMMSFSDMALVLLCFFVLLISIMKPDRQKFERVKEGINADEKLDKISLQKLADQIDGMIKKRKLDRMAQVLYDSNGLRLEFKDGLLFHPGSANTKKQFRAVVREVMAVVARAGSNYNMVIEGHTDDTPLGRGGAHRSNWELSAARGFTLMRAFHQLGVGENRISVQAYAHTRPKVPITKQRGRELRAARSANRRVVIWVE